MTEKLASVGTLGGQFLYRRLSYSAKPAVLGYSFTLEVGRIIEIDTDIAIFEKTETDSIFRKTEKYRLS